MTIYTEEHLCKGGTKWKWLTLVLFSVLALSLSSGLLFAAEDGYHPDIGDYAKIVKGREHRYVYNFGPTGLTGWFYEKEFVINGLDKGSPADGIVKLGDRVRAVNGRRFVSTTFKDDEQDPRRVLGYGITEAEAGDGKLKITVWRGGKEVDLTVNLPVTGSYAPLWPYDCKKSAKILKDACQWLVDRQLPRGSFVRNRDGGFALGPSLEGLLLLSSGDPKFLESARRLAYDFVKHPGPDPLKGEKQGTDGWGQSYQAMFVAEYYLRTGDSYVVPYLTWMREVLDTGMGEAGGWGHAYGHVGGYAVGGYINPVGVMVLNALALMDEAGIEGDPAKLKLASHYFRRWSYGGRGIHYGDHFNPFSKKPGESGTGKNAVATLAFEVLGEPDTAKRLALNTIDSYRHRDKCHTGPFLPLMWGPIAASRGTESEFKMFMDYWTWFHDLSRRWDGSFILPSQNGGAGYTMRGPIFTMGGQALVYALPLKKTRACGATESPFAVKDMPAALKPIKKLVDRKDYTAASRKVADLIKGGALNEVAKKRALLMQESLATTIASIEYTIAAIKENLKKGDSPLARTRIENLETLLGQDSRLAGLKKAAAEPRHDKISEDWQMYQANVLPSFLNQGCFEIIKKLAQDRSSGFVQAKAKAQLALIKQWPTYQDSFSSESKLTLYHPSWLKNKEDPIPLAVMRYLAFGEGMLWTTYVTRGRLEEAGVLGEFPYSTTLAPTSAKGPVEWTYVTLDKPMFPQGWQTSDFKDDAWQKGKAPFVKPGRKTPGVFDKQYLLMRRSFEVKSIDFDSLRIKGLFHNEVDIYLNGVHVARVESIGRGRKSKSMQDFDITTAGLPVLKKGTNVLAVKATQQPHGGYVDIGLLGVKRPE
jgi:hypothetical protein